MVTITRNNRSAEILATVRRGPFAKPDATEQLEYLFTRVLRKDSRQDFEKHALEHVLSFQRRVLVAKKLFLRRGKQAPLGIIEDYWDRTEAQQRGSLHAHILCWFKRKRRPRTWEQLPAIPRTSKGVDPRQRPLTQQVHDLEPADFQEDSVYQLAELPA